MPSAPAAVILIWFVLPLWLLAGVADWWCHRLTGIERTAGAKESVLHLVMFAEMGVPLLAVIFLEINAAIIALMIGAFLLHEVTAMWDVSYAITRRYVGAFEQHVHSFLELMPLLAIVCIILLHPGQFLALFGFGHERADFALRLKSAPLPAPFIVGLLSAVVLLEVVPYIEELVRCLRSNQHVRATALIVQQR
jgi:hypothetical protein